MEKQQEKWTVLKVLDWTKGYLAEKGSKMPASKPSGCSVPPLGWTESGSMSIMTDP